MLQSSCKMHEYVLVDTFCTAVASSQPGIVTYIRDVDVDLSKKPQIQGPHSKAIDMRDRMNK